MDRALYVQALRALDPSRPAEADQLVPRGGWDRFDEVALQVQAGTVPRYVLHGGVGVGKTSLLRSWLSRPEIASTYFWAPDHGRSTVGKLGLTAKKGGLVLVDGLDLVPEEAVRWFGPGSPLVTVPVALVVVAPHLVARWPRDRFDPRFTVLQLPPIPVLSRSGTADWAAVDLVRDLLVRRVPPALLPTPRLLGRTALLSGGIPRDAIRILRSAVLSAARRGSELRMEDLVAGERELRQDLEQGFLSADPQVLHQTWEERQFREVDPRLLTQGAVLLYEDREGRYALPHPVLWAAVGLGRKLQLGEAIAGAA